MITTPMQPERAMWIDTGIERRWRGLSVAHLATRITAIETRMGAQENGHRTSDAIEIALDFLADLEERQQLSPAGVPVGRDRYGRGLLLTGLPGTGKSTLAAAIACDVRRTRRSVYMIRYPEYIHRERQLITTQLAGDNDDMSRCVSSVERVRTSFLVVLDDIGHEHSTSSRFAEDTLERILRARYDAGTPTILTTNLAGQEWSSRYSAALRSFIAEACEIVAFTGPDLRRDH